MRCSKTLSSQRTGGVEVQASSFTRIKSVGDHHQQQQLRTGKMRRLAYALAGLLCVGAGALVAGLAIYYKYEIPHELRVRHAKCELTPSTPGNISGTIFFYQSNEDSDVLVTGNITGLAVGFHGFHIHTYGVAGGQCTDAMGHFNPHKENHGGPDSPYRHMGDLGNVESVANETTTGTAFVHIIDDQISMSGPYSIVGRSVVVHEKKDDLGLGGDEGSIATGNAGARLACCTIYIAS